MESRSPLMVTFTSFSLTPGTSTVSTRSSFVSCMSTAGSHARVMGAVFMGRPKNVSNRSEVPNGVQRTIAISEALLVVRRALPGPDHFLSTNVIYHLSLLLSNTTQRFSDAKPFQEVGWYGAVHEGVLRLPDCAGLGGGGCPLC